MWVKDSGGKCQPYGVTKKRKPRWNLEQRKLGLNFLTPHSKIRSDYKFLIIYKET